MKVKVKLNNLTFRECSDMLEKLACQQSAQNIKQSIAMFNSRFCIEYNLNHWTDDHPVSRINQPKNSFMCYDSGNNVITVDYHVSDNKIASSLHEARREARRMANEIGKGLGVTMEETAAMVNTFCKPDTVQVKTIPSGRLFRRVNGSFVYKRISRMSANFHGLDKGKVFGVGRNGKINQFSPRDRVIEVTEEERPNRLKRYFKPVHDEVLMHFDYADMEMRILAETQTNATKAEARLKETMIQMAWDRNAVPANSINDNGFFRVNREGYVYKKIRSTPNGTVQGVNFCGNKVTISDETPVEKCTIEDFSETYKKPS